MALLQAISLKSLPLRERGLKSLKTVAYLIVGHVAPFTGAWIEIESNL